MKLGALRAIASLSLAAALSCTGAGLATAQETAQGAMLADEGLPSPAVEAAGCAPLETGGPAPDGIAANGQATGGLAANDVATGAVTDAVTGETAASDAVADDSAANGPMAGGLAPDGGVTSGDAVQAGGGHRGAR